MDMTRRNALGFAAGALLLGAAGPVVASLRRGNLSELGDFGRRNARVRSMIVAHHGSVRFAETFRGPGPDDPVNVKSISKTLVAALTGAAIDRDVIAGVETRLGEVMPDLIPPTADRRVYDITVADLLTMQAGLERTSGRNYGGWVASDNWVADALSRPFVAEPGAGMLYSTGSYHLLGVALARASGRSLLALAREWLGGPLGVAVPAWTRDPQGYYMGGNEMALSPNALLRFGEMIRNGGRWRDAQVLSADWVARSWTVRTRSPFSGDDYGYGWFLRSAHGYRYGYGRGFGGQLLYVVPSLGITAVMTSDPTRRAFSRGYVGDLHALLEDVIIPAALDG